MDFDFSQEQQDIRSLAGQILDDLAAPDKLPSIEDSVEWFDSSIWDALATAGLLGVAIPEAYGGMGFGMLELGCLLEQVGRAVAPVPVLPTLILGGAAISEFGTDEQKQRFLPEIAAGRLVVTGVLEELRSAEPADVATVATKDGSGWRITGVKDSVPAARRADRMLVPAKTGDGNVGLFLLDLSVEGVELVDEQVTTGECRYQVSFKNAAVEAGDVLGDPSSGTEALERLVDLALGGLCAMELGVVTKALELTAKYATEREQFDKPIATFQAVAQRAADAYIDVEAIRLSTWQALWALGEGRDAKRELGIAKFWAADAGLRVTYAAQHLHGGIGVDTDYPLHRYYLQSKQIEQTLGGAQAQLARRGAELAAG